VNLSAKVLLMEIIGIVYEFDGLILSTESSELKSWESKYLDY